MVVLCYIDFMSMDQEASINFLFEKWVDFLVLMPYGISFKTFAPTHKNLFIEISKMVLRILCTGHMQ